MRPSSAPLTRTHPCRCKQTHPAVAMIAGLPLLICPDADGDAMRVAFAKDGMPYLLVGEPETDERPSGMTRLRMEITQLGMDLAELREALAKKKGKE